MNTQPEALRLANFLEMHWCNVDMPEAKAAAELRFLHAQRDALLAALRRHVELHDGDCICEDCAAIKAVEEGK